jgi:hypothetical protein
MTRPPQSNATPGAFRVGESNSVAGTVIVGTLHQDEQNIQTGSIAPVEAEIVEDDLQERRELEAQLQRVLEERENAPVAQVVDTSNWWTKRRNRLRAERESVPIAQVVDTKGRMPSVQEAQYEDAGVSGKHIRRLYVLVCAALVLVLVGIIVAVSLSLTIGKQLVPATVDNSNNTAPTPTVDTTPSPSPVNGATVPPGIDEVSFGGTFSSETGTQDPIKASTTTTLVNDGSLPPSSTRTMGEQLLDSPPQTLPPIREDPAPSPAPPDSRRAEQQREEKSLHYLAW